MKHIDKRLFQGLILLFIVVVFSMFELLFLRTNYLVYLASFSTAFIMIMALIAYLLFGIRKDKLNLFKKNCIYNALVVILIYFTLFYFSGLFFGYLRNSYALNTISIVSNAIIPLIFLVFVEIFRYILILSNKETKTMIVLTSVILFVFEVVTFYNIYDSSIIGLFKLTVLSFMPVLAKNLLCSYFDAYITVKLAIIYRLIFDLYIYIVPIFPNCGDYIRCIVGVLLPYLIYFYVSKNLSVYNHKTKSDIAVVKKNSKVGDFVFLGILILFVALTSCMFPLFLMSVGSDSMSPTLKTGDAVFAYKVNTNNIKKGDIIVFNSNNKIVIHRVNNLIKKNGKVLYETKGDFNNSVDVDLIEPSKVKGKVFSKIPFIGYPSILFSKILKFK